MVSKTTLFFPLEFSESTFLEFFQVSQLSLSRFFFLSFSHSFFLFSLFHTHPHSHVFSYWNFLSLWNFPSTNFLLSSLCSCLSNLFISQSSLSIAFSAGLNTLSPSLLLTSVRVPSHSLFSLPLFLSTHLSLSYSPLNFSNFQFISSFSFAHPALLLHSKFLFSWFDLATPDMEFMRGRNSRMRETES